jgi:aldehyde:ferredoxin oxidoreductase
MSILGGYNGKVLRVNLTDGTWKDESFSEEIVRKYLGGCGLGAKILYDETNEKTDPLGPDNVLIFMAGPLVGSRAPMSGRHAVVAKSPLTGIYGESDIGGNFGAALKRSGYDGVILNGKAEKPVYLWIDQGKVELRDATHLWGTDTYDLEDIMLKETAEDAEITSIGQAGEKLVKVAAIMSDGKDGRAAGRCGLGAVMGSKNLKAIAARGDIKTTIAYPDKLKAAMKEVVPSVSKNMTAMRDFGTTNAHVATEESGDMPIKNWKQGSWREGAEKTSGQTMAEKVLVKNYYCNSCFVGCGREVKVETGKYAPVEGSGPEYETMSSLGSYLLIDELEAICLGNELCNRYGMDTISVGGLIGFAMEAYEKGLIKKEDTGGIELTWGNADAMIALIHQMGKKEGLGAILGQGILAAADKFNGHDFAIHTKGLDLPAHDPRAFYSLAVGYATANRGGCHLGSYGDTVEKGVTFPDLGFDEIMDRFEVKGKGILNAKMQDLCSLYDAIKACKFLMWGGSGTATHLLEWVNAVTGFDMTLEEFLLAGERMFNLKRMYNVKHGISRKDDNLPKRILEEPRGTGGAPDNLPPLDEMLDEYYEARGWTNDGIPTEETLKRLDLEFCL